ncbi:DNA cytosine methyltransferase [Collimonas sp. NPDC087041]|uniref:DNA cytosine methyltransferase n=1 Tax=Collimonas sp. NPDC087041 TaxID=3363960 RepID=UPI003804896E
MKRDLMSLPLDLGNELIIDNFAGGGGTSTGLEQAFGRHVDIAINHDPEALAMHAINHPRTQHLCESVWDVDPIKVTNNCPVGLVWLSPDCKHFSKAKGGTPVAKNIRGLAWVGMRWAALTKPRVLMLENVGEFTTWGPLIVGADGKAYPDPAKKGKTFDSFVRQLRGLGYAVDYKELRACDDGAPTIRKRLFLVARRDNRPIYFSGHTHGDPDGPGVREGKLLPWRTAAECIDFTLPSRSIFGRKKPLAVNTQRRVAKGIWRHVLTSAKPFIVGAGGPTYSGKPAQLDKPFGTLTTENHRALAEPVLVPFVGEHANASSQRNMPANEPLRTICAQVKGGHFSVVAPMLTPLRGTTESHLIGRNIGDPLTTVSAGGTHHALVSASLITIGYGERKGQDARVQEITAPLSTVVAGGVKQAVVTAFMEQANGGFYDGHGRAMDVPISTITAAGSNQQLVTAYCVKYYSSGGQWQALDEPMHTLPTKARMGLVKTIQVPVDCLSPEHREGARACAKLLHEYLPEYFPDLADMVIVGGWVLVDIMLRMLKAPELFRAQGFPRGYIIHEIPDPKLLFKDGKQVADPLTLPRIPLTATAQVRMCGNSVSPYQANALARLNFAHEREIARVA